MNLYAEEKLLKAIGLFSTTVSLFGNTTLQRDNNGNIGISFIPGQVQAFLNSNEEFTWWIEEHIIEESIEPNQPKSKFTSKKLYPAKITGLGLPLISLSSQTTPVALRWREGLVRWGNTSNSAGNNTDAISGNFRPGFGEIILEDLNRPLKEIIIPINNLGLAITRDSKDSFTGTGGRLFAMAFYVYPSEAAKYNASKQKKKAPNPQDYETSPTYPAYTLDSNGY